MKKQNKLSIKVRDLEPLKDVVGGRRRRHALHAREARAFNPDIDSAAVLRSVIVENTTKPTNPAVAQLLVAQVYIREYTSTNRLDEKMIALRP